MEGTWLVERQYREEEGELEERAEQGMDPSRKASLMNRGVVFEFVKQSPQGKVGFQEK